MKKSKSILILLFSGSLILSSCGAEEDTTGGTLVDTTAESTLTVDYDMETGEDDFDFVLPSPLMVASILNEAGLPYSQELVNDPSNVSSYNTNSHKLLNFGTYSADLSYCVLNDEMDQAVTYLKTIDGLTEDLGLSTVFQTSDLVSSFENNTSNTDSLLGVLVSVQERLDEYVDDNDERFMHVTIMTGAWVEFMYLGYKAGDEVENINHKLSEQMTLLGNLMKGLRTNPSGDPRITDLVSSLSDLQSTYKSLNSVINNPSQEESPTLTTEEIKEIGTKVELVRQSLVEA